MTLTQNSIVRHHITLHTSIIHLLEQFKPLLPQLTPRTRRNGRIVYMNIRPHPLQIHPLHELKCNIRTARLLHARHGGPENNHILRNLALGHFIQVFKALAPLIPLLTRGNGTAVGNDGNGHVLVLHFIKEIKGTFPLQTLLEGGHGGIVGNDTEPLAGLLNLAKEFPRLLPLLPLR